MQFGHISQFAHGSVRFLRIECNAAFISRFLYYQMSQVGDGYFLSRADVDVAVAYLFCAGTVSIFKVHMLHNEHVDFKDTYKEGSKDIRNCHINIGTGKEITIRQLAERIVETVGYQGKLTFDSSKPDGTMRKLTDPSKLHALGWHHKIEIEEGVQRMYEWYLK